MKNNRYSNAGNAKKSRFPRWLIYVLGLAGCVEAMMVAGFLGAYTKATSLTYLISVPAIIGLQVFPILIIIYIIKAIVRGTRKKLTEKRDAPREVTYNEIHYSGDVEESRRDRTFKRFSYNKNDVLVNAQNNPIQWWIVVALLLMLFPIGLFLMIRKTIHEKTRYFDNGVNMIITGGFYAGITLPISVLFGVTGADDVRIWIFFTVLPLLPALFGVILIIAGELLRRKGKKYESYMKLIVNERVTKISVIASEMKTTYAKATEVIQKLIDAGFLPGAYIYHRDKEIIVPGVSKKIAFRCKNCGGTTVLYANEKQECAYCGAVV